MRRRMTHEPTPDEAADAEDLAAIEASEAAEDRKAEEAHEAEREARELDRAADALEDAGREDEAYELRRGGW